MRIQEHPAYVLLARPWSETSLLVDVFTREHGRFRVLAKGARRQKRGQRALLQAFYPLVISWSGKRGLPVLTNLESAKAQLRLKDQSLASAYYLSELLFKFLHANDPHEQLFDAYDEALEILSKQGDVPAVLRSFECRLLQEIGYGLQLEHDANDGLAIDSVARYLYHPDKGPVRIQSSQKLSRLTVCGQTLIDLSNKFFTCAVSKKESKLLLRVLLERYLRERQLHGHYENTIFKTRKVYTQMIKHDAKGAD